MVRRVILPCLASLLLYALLFGVLLDRPLSLGMFRSQIESRLARGAAIEGRKLVIIAGSNGPFSHRCEVMEPLLGLDCVNAGVAVGIGLDYLFARWKPLLRPGDIVYLPLEEVQYARARVTEILGADAAILFRHDRVTLASLPPDRWLGAVFASGPRAVPMSLLEMALVAAGFQDRRADTLNEWGDHIGHTPAKGALNVARLAHTIPGHETAAAITAGDGAAEVRGFIQWARAYGVLVIGGLPAGFAASPIPDATRAAIRAVFAGVPFLDLGARDGYPPAAFFDTPDHLNEDAQIARARLLAEALAPIVAPARAARR